MMTAKNMMAFANLTELDLVVYFYGKKKNTERAYRMAFKEFFALETTPARVEDVSLAHAILYLRQYEAKQDKGAARAVALKSLFRFLTSTERLTRNPLAALKIPRARRVRHIRHASRREV